MNYEPFMQETEKRGLRVLNSQGKLEKVALGGAALGAAGMANGALISDVSFSQAAGNSVANILLTNNDAEATYESAQVDVGRMFYDAAMAVKENNPVYVNASLNDIMSEWSVGINAGHPGEVYNGWTPSMNDGLISLTHGPFGYTSWSDLITQNDTSISVNLWDQFDFNNNGQFDAGSEQLVQGIGTIEDAFVGLSETGLTQYSASTNMVDVVPEPVTIGLFALGALASIVARKLKNPYH